jgi:hypothetical protein
LHEVRYAPEINDSQDEGMGYHFPTVFGPWSKFRIHPTKRSKICSAGWFPKLLLLLQEDLEELFGVWRKFFNSPILVASLLCAGEELFTRSFEQDLHGCTCDIVVLLECLPMGARELAISVEELEPWLQIVQLSPHKLLLLLSLNRILCAVATYEHR